MKYTEEEKAEFMKQTVDFSYLNVKTKKRVKRQKSAVSAPIKFQMRSSSVMNINGKTHGRNRKVRRG